MAFYCRFISDLLNVCRRNDNLRILFCECRLRMIQHCAETDAFARPQKLSLASCTVASTNLGRGVEAVIPQIKNWGFTFVTLSYARERLSYRRGVSDCPSICLSVCLSVHPSVCLSHAGTGTHLMAVRSCSFHPGYPRTLVFGYQVLYTKSQGNPLQML